MWEFFHSRTVQAISSWLGILSLAFTVLSKLSPAWVGQLTWPEAILLGISLALAATLLVAITVAVFAWGFRLLKPLPAQSLPVLDHTPDQHKIDELSDQLAKVAKIVDGIMKTQTETNGSLTEELVATQQRIEKLEENSLALHKGAQALAVETAKTLTERADAADAAATEARSYADGVRAALQHLFDEHKEHMSKCYSAQDEARRKGLSDLKAELEVIRRGCAQLQEDAKDHHDGVRESFYAVQAHKNMLELEREIEQRAASLYDELAAGKTLDSLAWGEWLAVQNVWQDKIDEWLRSARFYDTGADKVTTVRDAEYGGSWKVKEQQFPPDVDAMRIFKRHRIIHSHWKELQPKVQEKVTRVAFCGAREADVKSEK